MKIIYKIQALLILVFILISIAFVLHNKKSNKNEIKEAEGEDYFFQSHSFPYGKIDYNAQKKAAKLFNDSRAFRTTNSTSWEFAGPLNTGGRIVDIEYNPLDENVAYLAAASGGIFKTTNKGLNWFSVFDNETTLSIGDLAIAPSDTNIIYVGTGEPNGGSGSLTYDANGIYKSIDAGLTWSNVGLQNTRMTGHIAVHPTNPDIVYAACMGDMYSATPNRGLYKSIDGGTTWTNILFVDDSTGCAEVIINPQNPDIVFATTWKRSRYVNSKDYAGIQSGVWKSIDGGNNFTRLGSVNGLPPVGIEYSRIGIDLCTSSPNVVYCIYVNESYAFLGIYKSIDDGNNWTQTNDVLITSGPGNGQAYWYGKVKCDPTDPNILYVIGFDVNKTIDGGTFYSSAFGGAHVDQHAISVFPLDNNKVMAGNDGGLYLSDDGGVTWLHHESLPISQIYRNEIDFSTPSNLYFGFQDNGTYFTPSGNTNEYVHIFGGDGFQSLVNANDNNIILAGAQYGDIYKSIDHGTSWDPSAQNGVFGTANWNYPLTVDPNLPDVVYTGAQQVFRSTDFGTSWVSISPELTSFDNSGTLIYGTISFIDVSPINGDIIYAGTDDGKVWNTLNGGSSWNQINDSLPQRWVTCVETDPFDENTAYVTFSGYRFHDIMHHVYKTIDNGQTWIDIGSSLPDIPCNNIIADPSIPNLLFLATDVGVYFTKDGGTFWEPVGDGMPIVVCSDLKIHQPSRILVVGTYGRSAYKLDLDKFVGVEKIKKTLPNFYVFTDPLHRDNISVSINLGQPSSLLISIYDISGKLISIKNTEGKSGKNIINLNMNNHSSGIFLVNLRNGNDSKTVKAFLN